MSELGSKATGLAVGTPVVGGGGDQPAGAVGNGIVRQGVVSATMGTSGVVFAHADAARVRSRSGGSSAAATRCPGPGTSWGSCCGRAGASSGSATSWARPRSTLAKEQGDDPYFLLTDEAALAGPGAEGLFFLPYLTGERTPHFDPDAKGAWIGLTVRHGRAHMIRSLLEGATYAMRDSLELIREMGVAIEQVRALGRRCAKRTLAADPGRHLRLRRPHAQFDRGAGLRRRAARAGRHRRVPVGPRGVRRHDPSRRSHPRRSQGQGVLRPRFPCLSPALPGPARVVPRRSARWSLIMPKRELGLDDGLQVMCFPTSRSGGTPAMRTSEADPTRLQARLTSHEFSQYVGRTAAKAPAE